MVTYYFDRTTETVRRYEDEAQSGERWCKKTHKWSRECCPRSGCQWDEVISEMQAAKIIEEQ